MPQHDADAGMSGTRDRATNDARLAALYEAHAGPVWRYVVSLTHDRAGADDVVQETLLRAWRTPRIMEQDPSTARAWMITVARNLVIDGTRSARSRHEVLRASCRTASATSRWTRCSTRSSSRRRSPL